MLILSNSSLSKFTHCPKRYGLTKIDGWSQRETNDNLIIGSATHKGIEIWSMSKDRDIAYLAVYDVKGVDEDLFEIIFSLLDSYFDKWEHDEMRPITAEHDITFNIPVSYAKEGIGYRAILDGIKSNKEGIWVHEIKTSGLKQGSFWKKYQKDNQIIGNICAAESIIDEPIVGAYVDAIFKPGYNRPDPICERQFFRVTPADRKLWLQNTIKRGKVMHRAIEENSFYESFDCFPGYYTCEFLPYCTTENNMEVLRTTHILKMKTKEEEKSKK